MNSWIKNDQDMLLFTGGKEDWEKTAEIADKCPHFLTDDEDELLAEEKKSCYNCRYRRWTASSFMCMGRK
jgi:hypothetical protein